MTLDLYLIRHAQSMYNKLHEGKIVGGVSKDVELTHDGHEQAAFLGTRLKYDRLFFDRIYASSARRAIDTCKIAIRNAGYAEQPTISDALLELDRGDWTGKDAGMVYEIMHRPDVNPWTCTPPNGESYSMAAERMHSYLERELDGFGYDGKVAIFGHGNTFRAFLSRIMGIDPKMLYKVNINNTAITRLKHDKEGWHVITINDYSHLAGTHTEAALHMR